jgi:hypothetical protein
VLVIVLAGMRVAVLAGAAVLRGTGVFVTVGAGEVVGTGVFVAVGAGGVVGTGVLVEIGLTATVGVLVGVTASVLVAVMVAVADAVLVAVGEFVAVAVARRGALHNCTRLLSSVTAPVRASRLPDVDAAVVAVMDVKARTLPIKIELVPRVAELPTCQKTLHVLPLLITCTRALLAVMNVLPIWKMNTLAELPCASRVSVPVSWAEVAKQ